MQTRFFSRSILMSMLLFGSQLPLNASANDFDQWQNTLAPLYLWGVSMKGDIGIGPVNAPLDIEFSDAVSDLSGIFTIHYEGAKGNWGVIADYSFLNLTPESSLPNGAKLDVDFTNTIGEIGALYRFGPNNPWQLLAGFRSYKVDMEVKGLPAPLTVKETINDFIIGGRYVNGFAKKWTFVGRFDVGAGDSDVVLNAALAFDYRFTKLLSGFFGYRWLDYDVETGSGVDRFKFDVTQSGPLLALAFHW